MKTLIFLFILLSIVSCKNTNKKKNSKEETNIYYDKAHECRGSNNLDSAYIYFDKAQEIFIQTKDSLSIGKCLVNKAIILTDRGDYFGGQEISLSAQEYFNKKDTAQYSYICANYNNLGISSNYVKDYINAIKYYDLAINFSDKESNKFIYYKNKANTYKDQKKYSKAVDIYQKILPLVKSVDQKVFARFLSNFENVKYLNNVNYNPVPQTLKALKIQKVLNDKWGQNASYAHLINYYLDKNPDQALYYSKKMDSIAKEIESPADRIEALYYLTYLDSKNRLSNFKKYTFLNDSLQKKKDIDDNKFAFIRFDVEKNKTENQKFKLQNAENEIDILYRNIGIGSLITTLISGFFYYKKRKKRLEQEKEIEVKNTQLKMSKKVHDVVANGIYQVMTKIENQEYFDKDEALDELEFVYEKSRDISYEKADDKNEEREFSEKISELIGSFKSEKVNTYIAGNDREIWKDINNTAQEEVYQIIRELLVNMKKHSKANIVSFKFEKNNNVLKISYTDNGIGISGDVIYKNGLSSTVSRIETIGGEIIFDTKIEKGLKINISFPTH